MHDDIKFPEGEDPAEAGRADDSGSDEVSDGTARPKLAPSSGRPGSDGQPTPSNAIR